MRRRLLAALCIVCRALPVVERMRHTSNDDAALQSGEATGASAPTIAARR